MDRNVLLVNQMAFFEKAICTTLVCEKCWKLLPSIQNGVPRFQKFQARANINQCKSPTEVAKDASDNNVIFMTLEPGCVIVNSGSSPGKLTLSLYIHYDVIS